MVKQLGAHLITPLWTEIRLFTHTACRSTVDGLRGDDNKSVCEDWTSFTSEYSFRDRPNNGIQLRSKVLQKIGGSDYHESPPMSPQSLDDQIHELHAPDEIIFAKIPYPKPQCIHAVDNFFICHRQLRLWPRHVIVITMKENAPPPFLSHSYTYSSEIDF